MPSFDLRPATLDHAELIHALRVAGLRPYVEQIWGWDEAEQVARFRARFDPARYQLVLVGGEPIGALSVEWREHEAFLADIEIAPDWRGRGYGTAIIGGVLAEAQQRGLPVRLQVVRGNPARRLYQRLGFQIVGETPTHLQMCVAAPAVADDDAPVGLWRGVVRLVPHQPVWGTFYTTEAARIRAALGDRLLAIEHVGSTAVPGLIAKPIIDIMAGVATLEDAGPEIRALEAIGYERRPPGDLPGRLYLVLGDGDMRRVHLSLAEPPSPFWRDHLAFRDHLRADAGVASAYARLKRDLAARFPRNRLAYTDGKDAFIAEVLAMGQHEK